MKEYPGINGLGKSDLIPTGDVGFRNKLKRFLGIDNVEEVLSSIKNYAGIIYFRGSFLAIFDNLISLKTI
ncbi:MAG: hypothetical protein QW685_10130 [Saccharolobus sp.]